MSLPKHILIDGGWASGKSVVKGILECEDNIFTDFHQEPIAFLLAKKSDPIVLNTEYIINGLGLNRLIQHEHSKDIGWKIGESDYINFYFPYQILNVIEKIRTNGEMQTASSALATYCSELIKQKNVDIENVEFQVNMEDMTQIDVLLRANAEYILICRRNLFRNAIDLNLRERSFQIKYIIKWIFYIWLIRLFIRRVKENTLKYKENVIFVDVDKLLNRDTKELAKISKLLGKKLDFPKVIRYNGLAMVSEKGYNYLSRPKKYTNITIIEYILPATIWLILGYVLCI